MDSPLIEEESRNLSSGEFLMSVRRRSGVKRHRRVARDDAMDTQLPTRAIRPLPADIPDNGHRYTLAQRIQCLTLIIEGFSATEIQRKCGVLPRTQKYIRKRAFDRGFRPDVNPRILEAYVVDNHRPGRPKLITEAKEEEVIAAVKADRAGREKSTGVLAYEVGLSETLV